MNDRDNCISSLAVKDKQKNKQTNNAFYAAGGAEGWMDCKSP